MRYLVRAQVQRGKEAALIEAIDEGTLGRGSNAGDEYLHDMRMARVDPGAIAGTKMGQNRGPAAIAIARSGWKGSWAEAVTHSSNNCVPERGSDLRRIYIS